MILHLPTRVLRVSHKPNLQLEMYYKLLTIVLCKCSLSTTNNSINTFILLLLRLNVTNTASQWNLIPECNTPLYTALNIATFIFSYLLSRVTSRRISSANPCIGLTYGGHVVFCVWWCQISACWMAAFDKVKVIVLGDSGVLYSMMFSSQIKWSCSDEL